MTFLFLLGFFLLLAGTLTFLFPAALWRKLTRPQTPLANQASSAGFLLFLGLGTLGVTLVLFFSEQLYQGHCAQKWPTTSGTVLDTGTTEVRQIRSVLPAWRPYAAYTYTIDGIDFQSTRIDFGAMPSLDRAWLESSLAEKFPSGKTLPVYYNPANPAKAVLQPGGDNALWIYIVLGLAFLGISAHNLRSLLRDWHGKNL